ncbi:sterol desaturase family protein [Thalassotalea atypica]|uniref:sterol desaturase family protein n=1 Tax=Thalassotalea atypica TaxID=2054316 RepID=UPI0025743F43|nr:sterol desaturase family protein [Thalassotalea atypica]
MSLILFAIPLFLLLIIIELIVDKMRGTQFYQFNDAINSLSIGIFSRITGILKAAIPISFYFYLYENFAIWSLSEQSLLVWFFAFVAYDLAYYWSHRLNHRIGVMWGSHVVHHSSEEYNLTTALRQTSTPSLLGWTLYLPLALIGVSPTVAIACGSLNLIYQFWVHTRHINKMPSWYEAIFVTPSHHRVHHALNRDYIDKNYAGVFILWDKLFNSFQAEKDNVSIVYGVSHQLKSWNPIWANLQVYSCLLSDALNTRSWRDKIVLWFKPPGWRPDDVTASHPRGWVTTKTMNKYDVALSPYLKRYLLAQFIIVIGLVLAFFISAHSLSLPMNATLCLLATLNLVVISGVQEQKGWALWFEPIRILSTSLAVYLALDALEVENGIWLTSVACLILLATFYYVNVATWSNSNKLAQYTLQDEPAEQ